MNELQIRERRTAATTPMTAVKGAQRILRQMGRERWILGLWAGQRLLFLALTWLVQHVEHPYYASGEVSWQALLVPWSSWDAGAYRDIAAHGYTHLMDAGYAPLYPVLIWLTRGVPGNALWLASGAELLALYLLFDLVRGRYDSAVARRVVLLLAWTPFAAYFSAAYTESLFLLFSVAVFWAIQRDRLFLAGCCAAAATLTRQYGILLCIPLLGAISWRRAVALALPVGAFIGFWALVSWQLHTPLAPLHAEQSVYGRHLTWPWWGIASTIALQDGPHSFFLVQHTIVDLFLVMVALGAGIALLRLPGCWRESLYTWASILLILCLPIQVTMNSNIDALASAPRYLAILFPLVVPLAVWASSAVRERALMWGSLLGVAYLTVLFAAGIWIG